MDRAYSSTDLSGRNLLWNVHFKDLTWDGEQRFQWGFPAHLRGDSTLEELKTLTLKSYSQNILEQSTYAVRIKTVYIISPELLFKVWGFLRRWLCRVLGCGALWVSLQTTFRKYVKGESASWKQHSSNKQITAVGMATGHGLDDGWVVVRIPGASRIFSPAVVPTLPPVQRIPGA
jgi:hypothetical protein